MKSFKLASFHSVAHSHLLGLSSLFLPFALFGGDVFYTNPVVPGDHPDPSIIRVGKEYWATSTSSEWGPQFPLLHSIDLINWEQTGQVFDQRPAWAVGNFWAPEISSFKGRYYVYYVGRKRDGPLAIAVAVADKPSGPYSDYGPLIAQPAGSIDPVPCVDEKGAVYLVWKEDGNSINKPTPIWAQPLNEDGTKLVGKATELIRNDVDWEGAVVEGPYILRRGQWFYLFYSGNGCCGAGCSYALGVARAPSLLGPWQKNPANPILGGNAEWKCPGHGSLVSDQRGRYWFLYHAYSTHCSIFTGREAMLDEVVFGTDEWPSINNGSGPSAKALSPFGVAQSGEGVHFYDDFASGRLRPGWQWPQNSEPICQIRGGHLFLSSRSDHGSNAVPAILAHSTTTCDYVATTVIETASLHPGTAAGLSAFGDADNAVGLSVGNGKLTLWRRDQGITRQLNQADTQPAPRIYLRLTATNGCQFHFAASFDGQKWLPLGDNLLGKNLPPWDRSVRLALTVGGNVGAQGEFDSLEIAPAPGGNKLATLSP